MASGGDEDLDPYSTVDEQPNQKHFRPPLPTPRMPTGNTRTPRPHYYPSTCSNDSSNTPYQDSLTSRSRRNSSEYSPTSSPYSSTEYELAKEQETGVRRERDNFDLLPPDKQPQQWRRLMKKVFPKDIAQRPDQLALFLKVRDEWVHNEALARLFQFCLSSRSNSQMMNLEKAEVQIWSMLHQNDSLPNRCHVIALLTLIWTRLLSQRGQVAGERHRRSWQEVSTYQGPQDDNKDEAFKDFLLFLNVDSSGVEWGLSWTLRKLCSMLCQLATSKKQQTATDAVQLIRDHLQRAGPGFFLLHLVLVNAANSLLLATDFIGDSTIRGLPDWNATYAEPLLQYLEDSLRKEDIRVHHDQRQVLLNVLRPHVFHHNLTIRKCLTQLLQDTSQRSRLPDGVEMDKVEKEMAAFRLKTDKEWGVQGAGKGCQWREMRGKADGDGGRMEVQVHFYSHTLDCLKRQSSGLCSEVGPLLRAFDIRLSLEAKPFLTAVLQHEEHDLARLHVQTSHDPQQRLIHSVLEQDQHSVEGAMEHFVEWTIQVVLALEYLHGKGIVLVDLSLHSLVLHESTVKVVNFDSALRWKTDKDTTVETAPMRWLAPESLLEGRFSPASDVLAVGRLLYQICTGGLEPYGELYTADTDKVLNAVADCVPLYRWSCIPTKLYNLIKSCNALESERLPRLSVLKEDLKSFQAALNQSQVNYSSEWPELDVHQIARDHVPEKAKTSQIRDVQNKHHQGYENIGPNKPDESTRAPKWDSLTIIKNTSEMVVYEPMTLDFVDKWWPRLPDLHMAELGRLSNCPQPEVFLQYKKGRQRRLYPDSPTLQEKAEALRKEVSPSVRASQMLPLLLQLAEALERLHAEGWVYGDLSPDTVLVTSSDEILFHRLGRMRMYPRDENDLTHKYTSFQEACDPKRFPPETVQAREYGPYSEVYVFAVTAWEVLETLKPRQNSNTDGERVKPDLCDAKVFQVLQKCWREKAHRYTMNHVATELRDILRAMGLVVPSVPPPPPHLSSDQSSSSSSYAVMTEYLPHSAFPFPRQGRDLHSSEESRIYEVEISHSRFRTSTSIPALEDRHDHFEDGANRSRPRVDRYMSAPDVSPVPLDTRDRRRQSPLPRRRRQRSREHAQALLNDSNTGESDGDSAAESDRLFRPQNPRHRPANAVPRHVPQNPAYQSSGHDTVDDHARSQRRSPRGGNGKFQTKF